MALTVPCLLLVVGAVLATACSGSTAGSEGAGAGCFVDPLIGCAAPLGTSSVSANGTAFRAILVPLLAALPSAAAGTGFASLRAARAAGSELAQALGICFDAGAGAGPAPPESGCLACLSAAVAAVGEGCANDTRRAAVWRDGCVLAYGAEDSASLGSSEDGGFRRRVLAGETRSYPDSIEQTLADLAKALAQPKGQTLWKMIQSAVFIALAVVGAVTVVFLSCAFLTGCLLAETVARSLNAAAGHGTGNAAAGQGEGITVYVAATNGPAPVWSVVAQLRFY